MSRYFDEKTPRCPGCGWYGTDVYPRGEKAGQTYERCGYYGYIFHGETADDCPDFRTPRGVAEYLNNMKKKKSRTKNK